MNIDDAMRYDRAAKLEKVAEDKVVGERVRYLMQARDVLEKVSDIAMKDGVDAAVAWVKVNVR